ncbi:MAG: pyruvate carboxyltransferase [Actinobacteria bacterium]|nr:pyruvate carboxyltransferase [Cyanobacteriota bacterium]MCL5770854.1 pyruvate carboxyltransferase [Actinomycetota bacterium]
MSDPWKTKNWFVSSWNYNDEVTKNFSFPETIKFHDVTLRDGEQQAGLVFKKDEKIRIAEKLAETGIDRIEAGMPVVTKDDELAIKEIVKRKLGPEIFVFSRCVIDDVKRAAECGVDGIIIEIPSSKHIIEKAYGWSPEKAMDISIQATRYAKELGLYVVFFPVDMTRAELDWFLAMIEKVSTEGHMDALAVVDTMGVLSPHAVSYLIKEIKKKIKKPLEAHFHNDFNCAAANTAIAVSEGVEVVHSSVLGIGERAGMAAYEDVAMILRTMYGRELNIKFENLYETSKLVRDILNIQVPDNRPIVGDGIFDVESGIVTVWMNRCLESEDALEIFPFHWDFVGQKHPEVVLGKHSGGASIENWLSKYKLKADKDQINNILEKVKAKAYEKRGLLNGNDFIGIVKSVIG